MRRSLQRLLLVCGLACVAYGTYIPAKAWLAQGLLESAWERRLAGEASPKPWPWADTVPLARLTQPRLGIEQVVLSGSSGRVLAFGPGHIHDSARPGQAGNVVLSGHRDTHFRWLKELRDGDELELQISDGRARRYQVIQRAVYHEDEVGLTDPLDGDQLRLVTCYPFEGVDSGTQQRYVVTARPIVL